MKFEWKKQGKLLDRLESEATESAEEVIKSFFGVENSTALTEEQMLDVYEYSESEDCAPFLGMALRNLVRNWQDENDNYNILSFIKSYNYLESHHLAGRHCGS
jgi:hypothetical protein